MSKCPQCGKKFDSEKSMRCHYAAKNKEPLENKKCKDCGDKFYASYDKKYCDDCFSMEGNKNPNYQGKKKTSNCVECGSEIEYYKSNKKGLYCSECQEKRPWDSVDITQLTPPHEGNKKTVHCEWCGEKIEKDLSALSEHNFCGNNCKNKWLSEYYKGDNHPNWEENYNSSYTGDWWKNRKKALKRDGFTCQRCATHQNNLEGSLDVHHIKPLRKFDDAQKAHDINNLECLCRKCHHKVEKKTP